MAGVCGYKRRHVPVVTLPELTLKHRHACPARYASPWPLRADDFARRLSDNFLQIPFFRINLS